MESALGEITVYRTLIMDKGHTPCTHTGRGGARRAPEQTRRRIPRAHTGKAGAHRAPILERVRADGIRPNPYYQFQFIIMSV